MVTTDFAHAAAVKQALDTGLEMGEGDETKVSSNTDRRVTVFSTIDGEPRDILRIDAERVLAKRLPDGKAAFWFPGLPGTAPTYVKGEIKCFLSPDFDELDGPAGFDRTWLDSIGLRGRTCNMMAPDKGNQKFRTLYDRDDHAQKKHRNEWRVIQAALTKQREDRYEAERRAERETQRVSAEAMLALAGRAVSAEVSPATSVETRTASHFTCDQCDYAGDSAHALTVHKGRAHKE